MTDDPTLTIRLTIEYDGSRYHGWQRQPNGITIQEAIETAAGTITGQEITLFGSGRTDAGVHALGQTAHFQCRTRIPMEALQKGLNSLLPGDIVIHGCEVAAPGFHARYDVKSKIYRYVILNRSLPAAMGRHYHWWIRSPLDVDAMQSALKRIVGRHDFKAFEGAGSPRAHTVRHVMDARLTGDAEGHIAISIEADGFLRYMVRNLVGTLVLVGRGKLDGDRFAHILAAKDRRLTGATAPPQGLCLMEVKYDG